MTDTLLHLTTAGAAFGFGVITTAIAIGILRPGGYDEGWHHGYEAAQQDALDSPAIWRKQARRHHTDTHQPPAPLPENDVAADAALAGWAEELNSTGRVEISKSDLEALYMVPLAPMAELLRWLRVSFPAAIITLEPCHVVLSTCKAPTADS